MIAEPRRYLDLVFGVVCKLLFRILSVDGELVRLVHWQVIDYIGAPKGTRTPVFAVKGRRPRPLDDGRGNF
jgi:hypothetical protein